MTKTHDLHGEIKARKKALPWYKRCPRDWQEGTRRLGMSFELRGFYSECLDVMWELQGVLPKDPKTLAMMLGCDPRTVRALMAKLVAMGKMIEVEAGYYNPRMLADIRVENDPQSTFNRPSIDPQSTPKSTSKVPKKRAISTRDLETDKEREEVPPSSAPPQAKPKAPRGARLQPEWTLPDDWQRWARINFAHASDAMVASEAERFRDYWISKSGQQACKLDWEATWRNWCRTAFAAKPSTQPINNGRMAWDERRAASHERARQLMRIYAGEVAQ